jgi:hypothetical protein
MLPGSERQRSIFWPRPINHADMFVRIGDTMNVEEPRRDERARAGRSCGRAFANQLHIKPAFFPGLAQRGDFRIFVQFNMPAERQPFVELAMVDEQNLAVMNNKDGDGEINFFVDVGHAKIVTASRQGAANFFDFQSNGRGLRLDIFLLPHMGQKGRRSGLARLARKLKIFRHSGQANS